MSLSIYRPASAPPGGSGGRCFLRVANAHPSFEAELASQRAFRSNAKALSRSSSAWETFRRKRAKAIVDLDQSLDNSAEDRAAAILGTIGLLDTANYEISAWKKWVSEHPVRPIKCD
jgi:hypothetical protein